jgi:hypothetical protein
MQQETVQPSITVSKGCTITKPGYCHGLKGRISLSTVTMREFFASRPGKPSDRATMKSGAGRPFGVRSPRATPLC